MKVTVAPVALTENKKKKLQKLTDPQQTLTAAVGRQSANTSVCSDLFIRGVLASELGLGLKLGLNLHGANSQQFPPLTSSSISTAGPPSESAPSVSEAQR